MRQRAWRRGLVTTFVAQHRRTWDSVMTTLAVVYVVVAVRNDDEPGSVPPIDLLVLSAIFLAEFAIRCWDAPSRRAYLRRHWVDVVSCIPLVGGLRAVRLLRLLRLGATLRLLVAMDEEVRLHARRRQSLWFVAPCLLLLWVGSAYGIWVLEHGQNRHITSFGDALYWSFTTATTVGYGDIAPVTPEGRTLAGVLVFCGIGLLGFASARLTAIWLRQDASSDPVMHELAVVRAELAEVRRLLETREAPAPPDSDGC